VHNKASKPDKANYKRKGEFGSFANAKHNGGMFAPTWTMIDKPDLVQNIAAHEDVKSETFWEHSMVTSPVLNRS
jgi:hypothetical protein